MAEPLRIGIDTGGTFTDIAVLDRGRLRVHKLPSTPDDPARAVLDGLAAVRIDGRSVDVVHGTTVGLNAVLTGRLAKTAFVTNRGFLDLGEIGRQDRSGIYDLDPRKPEFPVPRNLRFEIPTRVTADGTRESRVDAATLRELGAQLARRRVESVAIGLLHSYLDPVEEREVARALRHLGVPITCSADLLPVAGEYERFATAALNAGIAPIVSAYVRALIEGVRPGVVRLMRSSGGIMSADEAREFPARAVFSGPAGGVAACAQLAARLGQRRVATLDMGGTSTDVAVVDESGTGEPAAGSIAGLPLATPTVDVHTIGCGGGSIAFADAGGALRVGPASAGADPGPACYGRGDDPTVTDAHVALGHLGATSLLDGEFAIEPGRSVAAITRLGKQLGLSALECARGILDVAETAMVRALMVMTVERRIDPAQVPLIAFGGAGGLHAAGLAGRLEMPFAIVPDHPGAFSAVGLALAGESHDVARTVQRPLAEFTRTKLRGLVAEMSERARAGLESNRRSAVRVHARLRFVGQGHGLWIDLARDHPARTFAAEHARRFGFAPVDHPIEVVELRGRASIRGYTLEHRQIDPASRQPDRKSTTQPTSTVRRSPVGGPNVAVHRRAELTRAVEGPAVIEETTGATVVPAGCRAIPVDDCLRIAWFHQK